MKIYFLNASININLLKILQLKITKIYFPMQNLLKISFKISSLLIMPAI